MDFLRSLDPKARAALGAVVAVLVVIVILVISALTGPKAEDTVDEFLSAFEEGDYETAAAATDGDSATVAAALEANVEGLDGAELTATVESVSEDGDQAEAGVQMVWAVPDIGDFEYSNDRLRLNLEDGEWRIEWSGANRPPGSRERRAARHRRDPAAPGADP